MWMKKQITNEDTFAIEVLNLRERVNKALKKEGMYTLEDILKCKNRKLERIVLKISKTDFEEILKFKENPNLPYEKCDMYKFCKDESNYNIKFDYYNLRYCQVI